MSPARTQAKPVAAIAARRNAASKDQYTLRLVLQQEGKDQDQTFIRLLAEGATNEFDMNVDLSKIINRGANIYSLIGKEEAAAQIEKGVEGFEKGNMRLSIALSLVK